MQVAKGVFAMALNCGIVGLFLLFLSRTFLLAYFPLLLLILFTILSVDLLDE
jgi:hypothetical protein